MAANTSGESWLPAQRAPIGPAILTTLAAFCTYTCMYAFRKPFAAASYADVPGLGAVDYKTLLVIAQVMGYTISKFLGIRIISELRPTQRAVTILAVIGVAQLALLGFAVVPAPWNIALLFVNGLPLGLVWGLVFGYLEGREYTDAMGAGLCASFILASGFVKSVASWLMLGWGVPAMWMPALTGLLFAGPLVLSVWALSRTPPPTARDEALRTARQPMARPARRALLRQLGLGLLLLVVLYVGLTAYRDFRDNFMAELWAALGYGSAPAVFTTSELWVALGVLLALAALMFLRDNRLALRLNLWVIAAGCLLTGASTWAFQLGWLSGFGWVVLTGLGTYLAYIPFNAILFDRLLAAFRYVGTAGFLIYVADSFGYLGSVATLLYKNFGHAELSWVEFFVGLSYGLAVLGGVLAVAAWLFFERRLSAIAKAI